MNILDLTHTISADMPVYPGTEKPKFDIKNTHERDGFRETLISMVTHTGTHMDPPAHIYKETKTLDGFPIESFVGRACVVDCRDLSFGDTITIERINSLGEKAKQAEFLLFCTGWDKYWEKEEYFDEYPVVDEAVIDFLRETGKKGIGLDTIGLDPVRNSKLALHKKLFLNNDCVIIENLTNLDKLIGKDFILCALPLKFRDADGSPIRAIAILQEEEN